MKKDRTKQSKRTTNQPPPRETARGKEAYFGSGLQRLVTSCSGEEAESSGRTLRDWNPQRPRHPCVQYPRFHHHPKQCHQRSPARSNARACGFEPAGSSLLWRSSCRTGFLGHVGILRRQFCKTPGPSASAAAAIALCGPTSCVGLPDVGPRH